LSILQDLTTSERGIACTTLILHSSGQRLVLGPLVMPATKQDAQGLGSAATYARRYALLATAGVAGEEDDDGHAASKETKEKPAEKVITESQAADLRALIQEVGETEERFLKWAQAKSLETLPAKLLQQSVKK